MNKTYNNLLTDKPAYDLLQEKATRDKIQEYIRNVKQHIPEAWQDVYDFVIGYQYAANNKLDPWELMHNSYLVYVSNNSKKMVFNARFSYARLMAHRIFSIQNPLKIKYEGSGDDRSCMVYGKDNSGALVSYCYTIAKARKQGLLNEREGRANFWLIMPDEMLANRCIGELVRIRYPHALKEWYLPGEFPDDSKNPTEKENGIDHSGIAVEGKETYKVVPKKEEPKRKLEDYYADTLPKAYHTIAQDAKLSYAKGITDPEYYNSEEYFSKSTLERIMKGHEKQYLYKPDKQSKGCLLYTSPSPRDRTRSRMPSSA